MSTQTLPQKESNLFRLVVKCYESKQYKKGIKAADQILRKYSEHGETLSMKGLLLSCLSKKTEAYDYVRRGLKHDLKSHVCWHVYGLLYRSDREYREAIKCYRNALRIDPDNIQILRDLSSLQVQMRDTEGFVETRQKLLTLKPDHRNNWIGFALAHHLNKNLDMAVKVLEAYEGTLEEEYPPPSERFEHNELVLYKVLILEEAKRFQEALRELEINASKILDKLSMREQRASLLLKLGRPAESEKIYWELLGINPDNYRYYQGLQACLGLKPDSDGRYGTHLIEPLLVLFKKLQTKFPKSSAAKRIPLDFLVGSDFEVALDTYVRPFLRKGIPSLFSDLKPLYQNPDKVQAMGTTFSRLEASLHSHGHFPASTAEPEPPVERPPTTLWLLFLQAQHLDQCGKQEEALEKIHAAIAHTPTVPDLYVAKAGFLERSGDLVGAAEVAEEARQLDLADRFLNSEAVRHLLSADQVEKAERTAALFTKDGDQPEALVDMQCMWYELGSGASLLRQGKLGRALKKFLSVHQHYLDMVEDQFDFHTYCLRKMTLRAYVHMLRFEDTLHSHAFFKEGAVQVADCYLRLHSQRVNKQSAQREAELDMAGMSAADRKKLRQKQRKAEAKAKKGAGSGQEGDGTSSAAPPALRSGPGKKAGRAVDLDPDGELLLQVEKPLEEAVKFVRLLEQYNSQDIHTHLTAFQVYLARGKRLLALKSLKSQLRLSPGLPQVHTNLMQFLSAVPAPPDATDKSETVLEAQELIRAVVDQELKAAGLGDALLEARNDAFLKNNGSSLPHRMAAAEAILLQDASAIAQATQLIEVGMFGGEDRLEIQVSLPLDASIQVHKFVDGVLKKKDTAERWFKHCQDKFPRSNYFQGKLSSTMQQEDKNRINGSSE